jgi:co-chaperonin GroES (HSP10)
MKLSDLLSVKMAEYNVLVRMDPVVKVTPGGIELPEEYVDRDALSRDVGTLVNAGQHAFSYAQWSETEGPPQPGDRVLIAMYDGKLYDVEGEKYRILKDKSVVAWWPAQPALAAAA